VVSSKEQIYNWLNTGLQQPVDRIKELFYFDKTENEFFSILVTDYFLFDEDFNINSNITSTYPLQVIEKLIAIENKDIGIIPVPRLGIDLESEYLLSEIDSFLNINAIDIENVKIWIIEETGTMTINLKDRPVETNKRIW